MNPRQLEVLQHCLGANEHGNRRGDRNYFCAGANDEPTCRELVALGYSKFAVETRRWGGSRWLAEPIYDTPNAAIDAAINAARGAKP